MELIKLAQNLHLKGDHRQAIAIAETILKNYPGNVQALEIQALVELEHGNPRKAVELLRRIHRLDPKNGIVAFNLGLANKSAHNLEHALIAFDKATRLAPDFRPALREVITVLANLGRFAEVEARCRQMIDRWPDEPGGYVSLVQNVPQAVREKDIAALLAMDTKGFSNVEAHASVKFALAQIEKRRGAFDAAFALFRDANRLKLESLETRQTPPSVVLPAGEKPIRRPIVAASAEHIAACDYVIQTFDKPFLDRFSGLGATDCQPIFIVGMPRSGSTLIEQILSTHPDVCGAGEINDLSTILAEAWPFFGTLDADGKRPDQPPKPKETFFRDLGAAYMKRIEGHYGSGRRIVNKLLGNYVYVGMIHLCLPQAIIIEARRNPLDNCVACFEQDFRTGNEFSLALDELGRHYRRYDSVMQHWNDVLPGRVLRVTYEKLVSDPDAIRTLVDACGLDYRDTLMDFHANTRPVRTASLTQVRQPMHANSVNRWQRYEAHLAPLITELGDLAAT
jgi:tetratricopeptide (TPR) repeat protein